MKDDYLWSKIGNDSEIEKLENALQIFRLQENQPPKISNNLISVKPEMPRKVFPVFRAIAAGFIFSFLLIGIWVYSSSKIGTVKTEKSENLILIETAQRQIKPESSRTEKTGIEKVSANDKAEIKVVNPGSKLKKQNFRFQKLIYQPKSKTQKNEIIKLTEEEKAAYEKLMLALTITSSKLKIVKDKVQNTDAKTAISTENKTKSRKK